MVAHNYGNGEGNGSRPAQAKSFEDPISINKSWVWWCKSVILVTWEV
jgi:hypothetical protein